MIITYSRLLKGYIAMIRRKPSPQNYSTLSMIAVKPTRTEAITTALQRLCLLKQ